MNKKFDKVREYTHILLGYPHTNMLGILRSLGEEGIFPIIFTRRASGKANSGLIRSKYAKHIRYIDSYDAALKCIMKEYGGRPKKCFLHIMNDYLVTLLDEHYDELKDSFYLFHGAKAGILSPYLDKKALCDLAEASGLPTPQHEIVKRGNLPQKLHYPIFIKALNPFGAWKGDYTICHSEEELLSAYEKLHDNEWIMEEFIEKKDEISLQGISVNRGEELYMPYQKGYTHLRENDYGTYMYYEKNQLPDYLIDGIQKAIRAIGFSGCFEVEFLQDKSGNLYFLEINLRYSGSNQGMLYGGVNLPMEWALSQLDGCISTHDIKLRDDRFYIMNEAKDIDYFLMSKKTTLKEWLKDVRKASGFYIFDKHDLMPAIVYYTFYTLRKIRALFRK